MDLLTPNNPKLFIELLCDASPKFVNGIEQFFENYVLENPAEQELSGKEIAISKEVKKKNEKLFSTATINAGASERSIDYILDLLKKVIFFYFFFFLNKN